MRFEIAERLRAHGLQKTPLAALSRGLAELTRGTAVTVNSVLPGLIHTAMWERAATEVATAVPPVDDIYTSPRLPP